MAKAKKCTLIFHGLTREVNMGTFPSISKARSYAKESWRRPYTIKLWQN